MMEIRKMIEFECAHQLAIAESTLCSDTIHGHSYKVELSFVRKDLMEYAHTDGMVIDFGSKDIQSIKKAIMDTFDHALIVPTWHDGYLPYEWQSYIEVLKKFNKRVWVWKNNPTAERIAIYIAEICQSKLIHNSRVELVKVRVHETRTGYAEFSYEKNKERKK